MILFGPFMPHPVVLDSRGKLGGDAAAVVVAVATIDATVVDEVVVDIVVVNVDVVDEVVADEVIVDVVTVVVTLVVVAVVGCELVACVDEVVGFVLVSESSDIEVVDVVVITEMIESVDVVIDGGKVVTVSDMYSTLEKKYSIFTLITGYTEYQIFMKKSIT